MVEKIIGSHDCTIFLNGHIDKNLIKLLSFKKLIAADGAAKTLKKLGLNPTITVGDADSTNLEENYLKIKDQDSTDFEKCLFYAKKNNLNRCLILGVNGGEIDHILGNAAVMLRHSPKFFLYFLDTYYLDDKMGLKLGIAISKEIKLHLKKDSLISFITFDGAFVKTKGLFWELDNVLNSSFLSLRNKTKSDHIEIKVKNSPVLAIADISYMDMSLLKTNDLKI